MNHQKIDMPIYPPRNEPIRKIEILEKREMELQKCLRTNSSEEKLKNRAKKLREAQLNLIKARLTLIKSYSSKDNTESNSQLRVKLNKEKLEWKEKPIEEIIHAYKK